MSLDNDAIELRVKGWKGFWDSLRSDDRELFKRMMNSTYKYASSIQSMPDYEQDLALLLSLVYDQHKTIEWLKKENGKLKKKAELP